MDNNSIDEHSTNEQNETLSMEHLPEQVVSEVFQYLDTKDLNQMAQASHNWKLMTENDTLLRDISCIKIDGKNIEDKHNVTRGIKYCDKLIINNCTISSKKFRSILKECGEKMKSIQIIDSHFTNNHYDRIFQYIAECCPMIESIEITSTKDKKYDLFKEADLEPFLACPNLHTIKIDGLMHENFKIIRKLLKKVWKFEFSSTSSRGIEYSPTRNAIFHFDYDSTYDQMRIYQVLPEPKEDPKSGREPRLVNYPQDSTFFGSFKANTYEVIDTNENDKTITIMDDNGITEDIKPSDEFFQEILDELKQTGECFVSLIHICHKSKEAPYNEVHGTIEDGIMNRPPYWN